MEEMDGLLLSGGSDIAPEFLRQPVPDPSILDKESIPSAIDGNSKRQNKRSNVAFRSWHLQRDAAFQCRTRRNVASRYSGS